MTRASGARRPTETVDARLERLAAALPVPFRGRALAWMEEAAITAATNRLARQAGLPVAQPDRLAPLSRVIMTRLRRAIRGVDDAAALDRLDDTVEAICQELYELMDADSRRQWLDAYKASTFEELDALAAATHRELVAVGSGFNDDGRDVGRAITARPTHRQPSQPTDRAPVEEAEEAEEARRRRAATVAAYDADADAWGSS